MGVLDKFLNSMRLNEDDYDEDDDYDDEEEETAAAPRRRPIRNDDDEDMPKISKSKVTPMPRTRKASIGGSGMEVCAIKPTSVEDSRAIVDTLLDNRTVVINLEGVDVDVAQRIMDYTSGANAALYGHLQKISRNIFIVTPKSVDITGDFQDLMNGSVDMLDGRK